MGQFLFCNAWTKDDLMSYWLHVPPSRQRLSTCYVRRKWPRCSSWFLRFMRCSTTRQFAIWRRRRLTYCAHGVAKLMQLLLTDEDAALKKTPRETAATFGAVRLCACCMQQSTFHVAGFQPLRNVKQLIADSDGLWQSRCFADCVRNRYVVCTCVPGVAKQQPPVICSSFLIFMEFQCEILQTYYTCAHHSLTSI